MATWTDAELLVALQSLRYELRVATMEPDHKAIIRERDVQALDAVIGRLLRRETWPVGRA